MSTTAAELRKTRRSLKIRQQTAAWVIRRSQAYVSQSEREDHDGDIFVTRSYGFSFTGYERDLLTAYYLLREAGFTVTR